MARLSPVSTKRLSVFNPARVSGSSRAGFSSAGYCMFIRILGKDYILFPLYMSIIYSGYWVDAYSFREEESEWSDFISIHPLVVGILRGYDPEYPDGHHRLHDKDRLIQTCSTIILVDKVDGKVQEGYFSCEDITKIALASSPTFLDAAHILSAPCVVYHHAVIAPV